MDLKKVIGRNFPVVRQKCEARDAILYALGVGAGMDPIDRGQLPFVYEKRLKILPSQASVLAFPGRWLSEPELGVDYVKVLHGEQRVVFDRPLRPDAVVRGEFEVIGVEDRGATKGAVLFFEKRLVDDDDDKLICRVQSTYLLRGDGGCGSWGQILPTPEPLPERQPDTSITVETLPQQALIYRLSGDDNPLHVDPEIAASAGFDRPVLHGLSTYGAMCLGIVTQLCAGDPSQVTELSARFSSPVFPGETILLELFDVAPRYWRVRARVAERGVVVLDRGVVRLH